MTERVAKKSSENGSSIDTRTVTKGKEVGERNKIFDRIIFLIDDTAHVCDRELLKGAGNGGREERAARLLAEPT